MIDARDLARAAFRIEAVQNLSTEDLDELSSHGTETSGTPGDDWVDTAGFEPDNDSYYEFRLVRPSDECPYLKRIFVRILVPRDRSVENVWFIWNPPVPPYDGPWFS